MKWQKRNAGQYEEDDVLCHPRAGGEGTAWENLPVVQQEPHGTPGLGAGSGNGETSECTPKSSQAELDESGKVWQRPGHSEATAGEEPCSPCSTRSPQQHLGLPGPRGVP